MNNIFNYEIDLVDKFIDNINNKQVLIREMPIRWGNIDVVQISTNKLPFTYNQIICLSNPSNAKIFMKIKNNRPISYLTLFNNLGVSESTFKKSLSDLQKNNLITKENSNYIRKIKFKLPNISIYGYEAKLLDFNKAYYQANENKKFVDFSYLVFPQDIAIRIYENHHEMLSKNSIGLIAVANKKNITLMKAKRNLTVKPYIRLLNLIKSQIN